MPVRVRLLVVMATVFATVIACAPETVVIVVDSPTPEITATAVSVLDDGTEGQDLQDQPTATADTTLQPTLIAVPAITAVASPRVPETRPAGVRTPTPVLRPTTTPARRVTVTPVIRPTAIPDRRATSIPGRRATAIPDRRATSTPAIRRTPTPVRRGTATPSVRPTSTIQVRVTATSTRPVGTATPVLISASRNVIVRGAITSGGGTSGSRNASITGAMSPFAAFSSSRDAGVHSGPLAPIIGAQ